MAVINKKYPSQCSYFEKEPFFSSTGIKKNRIVIEFYHKCNLDETIMCKRSTNLDMPLFGVKRICVVKNREKV